MALQTREQHIRRDRATSNICTAQVLLAVCAGMYAVWHGPEGLTSIARRIHTYTRRLAAAATAAGHTLVHTEYFDTLRINVGGARDSILAKAAEKTINLRAFSATDIVIALDERFGDADLADLAEILGGTTPAAEDDSGLPASLSRETPFLTHPTFHRFRSETEMLRYLHSLETKDLSLTTAMIPLGSCTMKLNATTEMIPSDVA